MADIDAAPAGLDLNDVAPVPARFDLEALVARLRDGAAGWVPRLFPQGRREGEEWRLANIEGEAPRKAGSCVIRLQGAHAGDWYDFASQEGGGPLNTLERATGLAGRELFALATEFVGQLPATRPPPSPPTRHPARDDAREMDFILSRAQPIAGTPAEAWLAARGLVPVVCPDLLFHPDLTCWDTRTGWPGVVARVRDAKGEPTGLHRTYLAPDGRSKAPVPKPRKMLGKVAGGAVRLTEPAQGLLGLAEGIETALAVRQSCPALPVWATLSAGNLEVAALPEEVRRVVILADHDASGAGRLAAETAARRLRAEGRRVWIALPPREGEDFNDLLLREGPEAVRAAVEAAAEWMPPTPPPAEGQVPKRHREPNLPVNLLPPTGLLPRLRADNGDLADATRRAWNILAGANMPPWLFRMGGGSAWVERDDQGLPVPMPLTENRLRHVLALLADWRKLDARNQPQPAHPPIAVVKNLLATPNPDLPVLAGVVTAPVFGRDGTLVTEPGYHPATRLLFEPQEGFVVPAVPSRPTSAEVATARALLLDDLLGDFPFTGEAERAHALAMLLLFFVREMVDGPTPLHLIEKPTPGTGASLMVETIAEIALGATPAFMAEGRDDDEWRKRLTAKLRSAPSLVVIDNLNLRLDSGALSAALTMSAWEDRVLGASEMARFPVRCVWTATGNNPQFSNEMARRIVRIRLDAHVDQPWRRAASQFRHADLRAWAKANRARLVAACLTLVQAWIAAGTPRPSERTLGSFDAWAATMGGILAVAGVPGFLANLDETYESADAEGAAWRAFAAAWWNRHGTSEVGTADLHQVALGGEPPLPLGDGGERSQRTRLGRILVRMRDRIFDIGDRKVRVTASRVLHQAQRWKLSLEGQSDDRDGAGAGWEPGEPSSGGKSRGWEPGEPHPEAVGTLGWEPRDTGSHPGSHQKTQEIQGRWEHWEPGELLSTPTHVHARAHVRDAEKGSQNSPGSQTPRKPPVSEWEPRWEPDSDVPTVPGYDALFDAHGLDPLSDEDRAQATRLWLGRKPGP